MNEFFDKNKALIITSLLMGIFVLSLHNIALSNKRKEVKELLLELEARDDIAESLEAETPESVPDQNQDEIIRTDRTHKAYNQENRKDQEAFEERLEALNQKLSSVNEISESADSKIGTEALAAKTTEEKKPNRSGNKSKTAESKIAETVNHGSSIRYSLLSRKAVKLPESRVYLRYER